MGLFDWFVRKNRVTETVGPQELPWDRHPSVYEFLKARKTDEKEPAELPDEARIAAKSPLRWAAGAMDGVSTHHMGGQDEEKATELATLIQEFCQAPTVSNKFRVYEFVTTNNVVHLVDPFIKAVAQVPDLNHQRLYELAHSFAREAQDRDPVKLGMAILGLFQEDADEELFQTLGRHDEFTLYSAVALSNRADAEQKLWHLAKQVHGWGRIHLVERLRETENPQIKDWMLREGYKNAVMHEYLAYICATTGGLLEALSKEDVDDELLTSASEIIEALIRGGPAESIDNYDDGAVVVTQLLDYMGRRASSLTHLLAVSSIRGFLADDKGDSEARDSRGWTPEKTRTMREQFAEVIDRPEWRGKVADGLRSENEHEFYQADQAARVLGIDTWDVHWERLQQAPAIPGRWWHVVQLMNEDRITGILALAEKTIPLSAIATGAGTEMGLGPGYEWHRCLDYLFAGLDKFPGLGATVVEAGLQSPVTRNRNMALGVLSKWSERAWPASMRPLLLTALTAEPDPDVKQRIKNVLDGRPLDSNGAAASQ